MLVATACPLGDLIFMEGLRAKFGARGEWEHGRGRKSHAVFVKDRSSCCSKAIYKHRYPRRQPISWTRETNGPNLTATGLTVGFNRTQSGSGSRVILATPCTFSGVSGRRKIPFVSGGLVTEHDA